MTGRPRRGRSRPEAPARPAGPGSGCRRAGRRAGVRRARGARRTPRARCSAARDRWARRQDTESFDGPVGSGAGRMAAMPTYIAFLRAINIGKRKFAKGAIVAACEAVGCTDVETYINTGNVRVTTPLRSRAKVEAALEDAFAEAAGFDVPTIVLTPKELTAVAAYAEKVGRDHDARH